MKKIVLILCGLVFGGWLSVSEAQAEVAPGAPTILVPTSSTHTSSVKPVLAGVTQAGTQVDIYIDQEFNGRASVQTTTGQTAYWTYTPFLNLSQGWHAVTAKAQNAVGSRSQVSTTTSFYVDLLVPSPTLLTPVVNAETTSQQPWIVGLSKGGMTLEVWIDGSLNGWAEVPGSRSDTQNFKYKPFLPLHFGQHTLHLIAEDSFGGRSQPVDMEFVVKSVVTKDPTEDPSSLTTSDAPVTEPAPLTPVTPSESVSTPAEPVPATVSESSNEVAPEVVPAPEDAETATKAVAGDEIPPASNETSQPRNVLTTIGWVLLALVAIGMISRGRGKSAGQAEELVKIDTTDSTPHVEVIRSQPKEAALSPKPSEPSVPPTPPHSPQT